MCFFIIGLRGLQVPLVGLFFYIYSGETLTRPQILGCLLIMAGVLYMSGLLTQPAHDQSALQDRARARNEDVSH